MPALAHTSLTDTERRAVELLVPRLVDELGDDLIAIWLYGSRARGEPSSGYGSDVDVLLLTRRSVDRSRIQDLTRESEDEAGVEPGANTLSPIVLELERWEAGKEIDSFFEREIERDAVILHGPPPQRVGAKRAVPAPSTDGMRPRSLQYIEKAEARARAARAVIDIDPSAAVSASYYSVVNAARAALSERDLFTRSHEGMWDLFFREFVKPGTFDRSLHKAAASLQDPRELADYKLVHFTHEEAEEGVVVAERFVPAVRAMLEG